MRPTSDVKVGKVKEHPDPKCFNLLYCSRYDYDDELISHTKLNRRDEQIVLSCL